MKQLMDVVHHDAAAERGHDGGTGLLGQANEVGVVEEGILGVRDDVRPDQIGQGGPHELVRLSRRAKFTVVGADEVGQI